MRLTRPHAVRPRLPPDERSVRLIPWTSRARSTRLPRKLPSPSASPLRAWKAAFATLDITHVECPLRRADPARAPTGRRRRRRASRSSLRPRRARSRQRRPPPIAQTGHPYRGPYRARAAPPPLSHAIERSRPLLACYHFRVKRAPPLRLGWQMRVAACPSGAVEPNVSRCRELLGSPGRVGAVTVGRVASTSLRSGPGPMTSVSAGSPAEGTDSGPTP